jgi:uncharacterized delta-60 repeat protein
MAFPLILAGLMLSPPPALGLQEGVPDSSFGAGGFASVSAAAPGARESGQAMVIDSQDRVIVGGGGVPNEPTEPKGGWVLARFRSDGTPDPSFGVGGIAKEAPGLFGPGLGEFGQEIRALAIEPGTGKIIAGGMTVNGAHRSLFTIARYNSNGSLDTSFGPADTGFVTNEVTAEGGDIEDIAVSQNGTITAVGSSGLDAALARWDSDGNLDQSFDGPGGTGNGVFTDLLSGTFDDLRDVAVEPSGAVRAVGVSSSGAEGFWLIVRYTATGERETTFNGTGELTIGFGGGSDLGGGQVLDGNSLYVFGSIDTQPGKETKRDLGVSAFNATTGLEISGTTARVPIPGNQNLIGAGLQRLGGSSEPSAERFLLVGTGEAPGGGGALLAAMRRVGGTSPALEADPDFGSGGLVLPPRENGIWADVATDSRNRVVVGGELGLYETADLSAGRYVDVESSSPDTTAPVISGARVVPRAWAVNPRGRAETPVASAVKRGTSFLFTMSEAARVTVKIERRKHRRNGRVGFSRVGAFSADGSAGPNRRRFSGRIGKKRLRPGRYRATLVATDTAGNASQPKSLSFRVLRRARRH